MMKMSKYAPHPLHYAFITKQYFDKQVQEDEGQEGIKVKNAQGIIAPASAQRNQNDFSDKI